MDVFDATEAAFKNGYERAVEDFQDRIEDTVWYHINKNGELVLGANGETDIPLYRAEDILKIVKELFAEAEKMKEGKE